MEKVLVAFGWNANDRQKVSILLQSEISRLEKEEKELRKTIRWEATCFSENKLKREKLSNLKSFIDGASSAFLELNRANFKDFVE